MSDQGNDLWISVGLTEKQYIAALTRFEKSTVDRMKAAQRAATQATRAMDDGFNRASRSASRFGTNTMRQVGLQMNQVVQVGGMTGNWVNALAVQLPDLLLPFGMLGIYAGVVAGAMVPFVNSLASSREGAKSLEDVISDLSESTSRYEAAVKASNTPMSELRDRYGEAADEAKRLFEAQRQLEELDALGALRDAQMAIADTFGSIEGVTEDFARSYALAIKRIEELNRSVVNERGISTLTDQELAARTREIEVLENIVSRVRPAIARITNELGLSDEAAGEFLATLVQLRNAETATERFTALAKIRDQYMAAVQAAGDLTEQQEEHLRALLEASIKGLHLETAMQGVGTATSGAADQAARLAEEMGIALSLAQRIAAMGPQGGEPQGGRGGDPRDQGGSFFDWRNREADAWIAAQRSVASGGAGGGGGAASEPLMAATDRQIDQLRQQRELLGETAGRVAELTAKWGLLAEAKARGLDLDARQIDTGETLREQIERQAKTIGDLTASYERAEERARFFEQQQDALKSGLVDAIVEGENFAGVLADVAKALAKAALQAALFGDGPFGGGGGGLLGGLFSGLFGGLFADGAAFSGGKVTPFARGGVVSRPTLFPMANGAGLMGEAGPEAIMPLRRIGGRLGVDASGSGSNVVVNVQTEPGLQGYAQETRRGGTREVTVQVTRMVADDIQNGGETYRAMRRTFGLRPSLGGGG